jgi:hypothetical protein
MDLGNRPVSSSVGGSRHLADDVVDADTWEAAPGLTDEILPKPLRHAVVRGRPLFRPRMVISPLGPIGVPAARRTYLDRDRLDGAEP